MAFFLVSTGFFFAGNLQAAEALKSASIEPDNQAKSLQNKSPEVNERAMQAIGEKRLYIYNYNNKKSVFWNKQTIVGSSYQENLNL